LKSRSLSPIASSGPINKVPPAARLFYLVIVLRYALLTVAILLGLPRLVGAVSCAYALPTFNALAWLSWHAGARPVRAPAERAPGRRPASLTALLVHGLLDCELHANPPSLSIVGETPATE
jgi:hypothetical protein